MQGVEDQSIRGVKMQRNAAGLLAMLGLVGGVALAGPIYIDSSGREWLDVNATRYRSWDDTAAVCSATTGDFAGVLASNGSSSDIDLTGYTWASRDDVRDLFYEVAGLPAGSSMATPPRFRSVRVTAPMHSACSNPRSSSTGVRPTKTS